MKLLLLIIFLSSISALAQDVKYIGDKETKIAYRAKCEESKKVLPENKVEIFTDEELKESGFKQQITCTLSKPKPKTSQVSAPIAKPNSEEKMESKSPEYLADKTTKQAYRLNCYEALQIRPENRAMFYTSEEAGKEGFTISSSCSAEPKPKPPTKQAIRNPAKAYNILSVLNYPEYWTDRQITITGRIKLASLPIRDGSGRRVSQAFHLLDDSGSIIVYSPESGGTAELRDAIIRNDGDPLEGRFTFFVPKELDQSIGQTNETIGKLVKYVLF